MGARHRSRAAHEAEQRRHALRSPEAGHAGDRQHVRREEPRNFEILTLLPGSGAARVARRYETREWTARGRSSVGPPMAPQPQSIRSEPARRPPRARKVRWAAKSVDRVAVVAGVADAVAIATSASRARRLVRSRLWWMVKLLRSDRPTHLLSSSGPRSRLAGAFALHLPDAGIAGSAGERLTRAEAFDLVRRTVNDLAPGDAVGTRERSSSSRATAARSRLRESERSHVRANSQGRARQRCHRSSSPR